MNKKFYVVLLNQGSVEQNHILYPGFDTREKAEADAILKTELAASGGVRRSYGVIQFLSRTIPPLNQVALENIL